MTGGLLANRPHPTMWIRLWVPNRKGMQQRAYTVVNPDPDSGAFDLEFALHEGPAANWARLARPGDTIVATVLGSKFDLPHPAPAGYVVVGDTASLPAINTLLTAVGEVPARVWLEWVHDDDRELPVAAADHTAIRWVQRTGKGHGLVRAVQAAAFDASGHFGWVACDTRTTRAIVRVLRNDYRIARNSIKAQAYWLAWGSGRS